MTPTTKAGYTIWKAWCDGMLAQGRHVAPERTEWETLDQRDRDLDAAIEAEATAPLLARIAALESERDRLREFLWQHAGMHCRVHAFAYVPTPDRLGYLICKGSNHEQAFLDLTGGPTQPAAPAEPDVVALMRREHRPVPYRWSQSGESGTVCAASIAGLHHRVTSWPCDVESAICAALTASAEPDPTKPHKCWCQHGYAADSKGIPPMDTPTAPAEPFGAGADAHSETYRKGWVAGHAAETSDHEGHWCGRGGPHKPGADGRCEICGALAAPAEPER